MTDIYATVSEQPQDVQARVVEAMRLRAEEPEMQRMLDRYLSDIDVPGACRSLEEGGIAAAYQ